MRAPEARATNTGSGRPDELPKLEAVLADIDAPSEPGDFTAATETGMKIYTAVLRVAPSETRSPYVRHVTPPRASVEWQPVCRLTELEVKHGALALVRGQAVALFRTDEATVYALANHDPFDRHAIVAKWIVGRDGDQPFVVSPLHKHAFDLRTGQCLSDPHVRITAYDVKVIHGVVLVGHRKPVAAT
jgi:nitrite reductase (NADH) small subunit